MFIQTLRLLFFQLFLTVCLFKTLRLFWSLEYLLPNNSEVDIFYPTPQKFCFHMYVWNGHVAIGYEFIILGVVPLSRPSSAYNITCSATNIHFATPCSEIWLLCLLLYYFTVPYTAGTIQLTEEFEFPAKTVLQITWWLLIWD